MAVRPKSHSHLALMLGAISMKAISNQGFYCLSPGPCLGEDGQLCLCDSLHTGNCVTTGQKSGKPHLAFVDVSQRLTSVERSANLLMVVCNGRKRIS